MFQHAYLLCTALPLCPYQHLYWPQELMFYVKLYQEPSHPVGNLWPELAISSSSMSAKHSVCSGRAELSSLQCSVCWGWGWVSASCCQPAFSVPAWGWSQPLTWWHLWHGLCSVTAGWHPRLWALAECEGSLANKRVTELEQPGAPWSQWEFAVSGSLWKVKAKAELGSLGADWGLEFEPGYRLSSLLTSSQTHTIIQIFLKLLSKKWWKYYSWKTELVRCWVNCLLQDAGLGSTGAGPGESGRTVAQTHSDTEHQGLPLPWLAVSSKQLLQLLPLKIRQLIVLHNSCLQVVHIWW